MAMLRNLRNLIKAGISDKHHNSIIRRLTDQVIFGCSVYDYLINLFFTRPLIHDPLRIFVTYLCSMSRVCLFCMWRKKS
jgi:hypothetical protein